MRILAIYIIVVSIFIAFSDAHAEMNGAGGSWETSSPFGGGDFGAGGSGGSWGDPSGNDGGNTGGGNWGENCEINLVYGGLRKEGFNNPQAACSSLVGQKYSSYTFTSASYIGGELCSYSVKFDNGNEKDFPDGANMLSFTDCTPPPECPSGTHLDENNQCVSDNYCPEGYKRVGDSCEWQCPEGMKMQGGNCVNDDKPDDCDPNVQECDEDGKPKCNICAKLTSIINNQQTQINNQNRMTSLLQQQVTNQYQTNNLLNTANNKLDTLINVLNDKGIDIDTTSIEQKLDELIAKEVDLRPTISKLDELIKTVKESKYDDTKLLAKLDEILEKQPDFTEVTDRQDDQTEILEDIRELLVGEKEASFESPQFDPNLDPWSAIRGFDIDRNLINAQKQCPSGDAYSFTYFGVTYDLPMHVLCDALAKLAPAFLFLAYITGAFIIVGGRN